ncbi:hypothetical protein [Nitrosospira sp. NRS527]|nr:hypothetical protein [Nitrosospira sp. NRS527]
MNNYFGEVRGNRSSALQAARHQNRSPSSMDDRNHTNTHRDSKM